MAEMAAVTQDARLDGKRLAAARWQIAKASRVRLELWGKVRAYLVPRADTGTKELLLRLTSENTDVREAGSAMIAQWYSEAIEADWPRYCEAARQIRRKQMSIVRHERRDLLPILSRRDDPLDARPFVEQAPQASISLREYFREII